MNKQTVGKSMQKVFLLVAMLGLAGLNAISQEKSHYVVEDNDACDEIYFYLKSASGTCDIRTRSGKVPITIMGQADPKYVTPEFGQDHKETTLKAWLTLHDKGEEGFGTKLSKLFGKKTTDNDNYWNIYLTNYKPYRLNLNYALGKSYVDLSNIAVERLIITSGNAHVKVGYHAKEGNRVEMDTFQVNVDLGDIEINQLNLAKAKVIMAEVGFGTLVLNFSKQPEVAAEIWARVGAGNLEIELPSESIPMIIFMKNTSYRKLHVPKNFKMVRENVYVSQAYDPDAPNLQTFNIDLSMGNVVFAEK